MLHNKTALLKTTIFVALLSLVVTACNNNNSSTAKPDNTSEAVSQTDKANDKLKPDSKPLDPIIATIKGKVISHYYAANALVCLDINADNKCQAASEPVARTNDNGKYKLELKQSHQAANGQSIIARTSYNQLLKLIFQKGIATPPPPESLII